MNLTPINISIFNRPIDDLKEFLSRHSTEWIEIWREAIPLSNLDNIRISNFLGFELGVRNGWWEDWDNNGPIAFPKIFSISELGPVAHTGTIAVSLGMFPSISQARKNGFNKPLTPGTFFFTKKNIRVRIIP